jgi:hypothetical protein
VAAQAPAGLLTELFGITTLQNAAGEEPDVFLYCKSHLRPGASVPEPEALEPFPVSGKLSGFAERLCEMRTYEILNDGQSDMLGSHARKWSSVCAGAGAYEGCMM